MMSKKLLSAMATIAATALSINALSQNLFSLDNTVFGGNETRSFYPYDMSAWPSLSSDDIFFYNSDYNLMRATTNSSPEKITSYKNLQPLLGGWFSILNAPDANHIWATNGEKTLLINLPQLNIVKTINASYDNIAIAPQSGWASYTVGANLFVSNGQETKQINPDSEPGILYGSTVHRNEFGIEGGMFWSPNGLNLCFYRKDESMVTNYPLVDVKPRTAEVVNTRYPMAGETSEQVTIGIYNVLTNKTLYLKTESPVDRYFTNISWSPDNKTICIAEINRDQNHAWINLYDATTGNKIKTLFEEQNDKWIEPCEPAKWTDDSHFVWLSYRNGFRHIYLYDTNTSKSKQLTKGNWCVTKILGYNSSKKLLLIQTNQDGYLYRDVCTLSLKGSLKQISDPNSFCTASYADDNNLIAINTSRPDMAKRWAISDLNGKSSEIQTITDPYVEAGFKMPQISLVPLKSADGNHDLSGRLILPPDFDASKSYPVLIYVYGGPHSQMVDGSWLYGADLWMLYFAQEGYIIFSMDNRGTEMRGSEFEQAIHRQLGKCETEDQMQGVEFLKSLPYVDKNRIGVYGWSFGGFMTLTMLTSHPDDFNVGVAGGPVCDWKYYEVMYGERYMDTPQQNPDGYYNSNISNKIENLKAKLLVIQGAMDSTVVWQNCLQLTNAAIEKGIFFDSAIYPNHPHNVRGKDRVHLVGRIKQYFDAADKK